MLEGDCGGSSPPLLPPEDVVRSVFELGGRRLSIYELDEVLNVVRGVLTHGSNPVQEESISSSSSSSPSSPSSPGTSTSSFWFLLSSSGTFDHVSDSCQPLLGYRPTELRRKSAFGVVAGRDHHILPPIIHVGPCTSMTCRLHLQTNNNNMDAPFDVTFAKLSTRQLGSQVEKEDSVVRPCAMCEVAASPGALILSKLQRKNHGDKDWILRLTPNRKRSTTLCVARAVPISHGKLTFSLDSSFRVVEVENKSQLHLEASNLLSRHVSELVAKSDSTVLDTLLEAQSECSAKLSLSFPGVSATASVRSVHFDAGVVLHCDITKIESCSLPTSEPPLAVSITSKEDPLSKLCSTIFTEEAAQTAETSKRKCTSPSVPQTTGTLTTQEVVVEKPKRPRKPRSKKAKAQPEKDACLKKLLASRPSEILPESASGDYGYIDTTTTATTAAMYQASTMSAAQPMFINNNLTPMAAYQQNQQCSSYMPGAMCPGGEYALPPQAPMVPWQPDYYSPTPQQQQVPFVPAAQTKPSLKRKPAAAPERPNKMPYSQNPAFSFQQAGNVMEPAMSTMPDDFHLQPMNGHLSPFRYSPGSSPYWPANGGRPPSRSEMIRMELRNSLQAKQMAANQQRQPSSTEVPQQAPASSEAPSVAMGADSLGFDLDIVLKDADGSLMDSELETVYDFNLGGGCGFDMENESTKCLVMKLLS